MNLQNVRHNPLPISISLATADDGSPSKWQIDVEIHPKMQTQWQTYLPTLRQLVSWLETRMTDQHQHESSRSADDVSTGLSRDIYVSCKGFLASDRDRSARPLWLERVSTGTGPVQFEHSLIPEGKVRLSRSPSAYPPWFGSKESARGGSDERGFHGCLPYSVSVVQNPLSSEGVTRPVEWFLDIDAEFKCDLVARVVQVSDLITLIEDQLPTISPSASEDTHALSVALAKTIQNVTEDLFATSDGSFQGLFPQDVRVVRLSKPEGCSGRVEANSETGTPGATSASQGTRTPSSQRVRPMLSPSSIDLGFNDHFSPQPQYVCDDRLAPRGDPTPTVPAYHYIVKMTCSGCSGAIERVLKKNVEAPNAFHVSLPTQRVLVWGPSLPLFDTITEKIAKTGKEIQAKEVIEDAGKLPKLEQ